MLVAVFLCEREGSKGASKLTSDFDGGARTVPIDVELCLRTRLPLKVLG